MNLKEAFRYQNKLQQLLSETVSILSRDRNVTKVENTALLHKVNPDAENETTLEMPETEYSDNITQLAAFAMFLLNQKTQLNNAICFAKREMDINFDGEVSLNGARQQLAQVFRHMSELRCSEVTHPGAGIGYKFNAEGNQVSYRCDLKKVTTINFDRNKVRAYATFLSKEADFTSTQLDKMLVNTEVYYQPPFDVNDSFPAVFRQFEESLI